MTLIERLRERLQLRYMAPPDRDGTVDQLVPAELLIEATETIEVLTAYLERIAFDGVKDRGKLTRDAIAYMEFGDYPNERTLAAFALHQVTGEATSTLP